MSRSLGFTVRVVLLTSLLELSAVLSSSSFATSLVGNGEAAPVGAIVAGGVSPFSTIGSTIGEYGARSRRETVVSLPLHNLTWAYCGFASISSASSTIGSYFEFRTCLFNSTGPGVESQEGTD